MASGPRSTKVLKMHLLTMVLAHNNGPLGCTLIIKRSNMPCSWTKILVWALIIIVETQKLWTASWTGWNFYGNYTVILIIEFLSQNFFYSVQVIPSWVYNFSQAIFK